MVRAKHVEVINCQKCIDWIDSGGVKLVNKSGKFLLDLFYLFLKLGLNYFIVDSRKKKHFVFQKHQDAILILISSASSQSLDEPAHPHSLTSAFMRGSRNF